MLKITYRQIESFVFGLPIDVDYESRAYLKVVMEQIDLQESIEAWLKSLGVEVEE